MSVPNNLKYTKDHEWLKLDDDGTATVGITEYAQRALGEVVYVDLPEMGTRFAVGDECGTIESVKAVGEVYSPAAGEVVEVNDDLESEPERINDAPYDAWIFKLRLDDPGALNALMDAEQYTQFLDEVGA